jgi:hypothetical protein
LSKVKKLINLPPSLYNSPSTLRSGGQFCLGFVLFATFRDWLFFLGFVWTVVSTTLRFAIRGIGCRFLFQFFDDVISDIELSSSWFLANKTSWIFSVVLYSTSFAKVMLAPAK